MHPPPTHITTNNKKFSIYRPPEREIKYKHDMVSCMLKMNTCVVQFLFVCLLLICKDRQLGWGHRSTAPHNPFNPFIVIVNSSLIHLAVATHSHVLGC